MDCLSIQTGAGEVGGENARDSHAIHAVILTLDEERHIGRCIRSLAGQCASVTVVDSGSSDRTVEIARELGAEVLVHPFVTHARQVNFAADALAFRGGWLFRIDADEALDAGVGGRLRDAVASAGDTIGGFLVSRRIHFLGRRIRFGGIEPSWQLRLWRNGRGRCEQRWMDEHVVVEGEVVASRIVVSDINLNSITWWTAKHNGYASKEAIETLNLRHGFMTRGANLGRGASPQAAWKRFVKEKIYLRLPPVARALLYFCYRYIFLFGFLDGREGTYFHLLQGFWYRTLVDAKVMEVEAHAREHSVPIPEAIRRCLGVDTHVDDHGLASATVDRGGTGT